METTNQKIELSREDAIKLIDICDKAVAYEELQRGHYEMTYTTKNIIDNSVKEIWRLKYRLKNLLIKEKD